MSPHKYKYIFNAPYNRIVPALLANTLIAKGKFTLTCRGSLERKNITVKITSRPTADIRLDGRRINVSMSINAKTAIPTYTVNTLKYKGYAEWFCLVWCWICDEKFCASF